MEFALGSLPKGSLAYAMGAFPRGGDGESLIKEMRSVIAQYVKRGFPRDLVEAEKRHEVADAEFEKNSVEGLAMSWSAALALEHHRSPDEDIEDIKRVTVSDVNRVARKYLDLDHAIVTVMTPEASGKATSSSTYGGHESFTSKEAAIVPLPDWAAAKLAQLPACCNTMHPVVTMLTNGLQLIVQPETISDTVSVYGRVRNYPGLEMPEGQEGVDQVPMSFSRSAANHWIALPSKRRWTTSARTSRRAPARGGRVDKILRPGYATVGGQCLAPGAAGKGVQDGPQTSHGLGGGIAESPDHLTQRALFAALYPKGDPALREATMFTVSTLTLDNVRAYHQHVFRPDLTTIVVIGNVTPDQAKTVIGKWFGDWPATGTKPETVRRRFPTMWRRSLPCPTRAACRTRWCSRKPSG